MDRAHDILLGLLDRLICIDDVDEVIFYRVKNLPAELERFSSLKLISLSIADPNSGHCSIQ